MDTFLDALGRSLFVLCYAMLVHPLLVIPLALYLVLEIIVLVRQPLPLASTVSELYVHTSHDEENTEHLNEDPSRVPVLSLLGSLYKAWWWRYFRAFWPDHQILINVLVDFSNTKNVLGFEKVWLRNSDFCIPFLWEGL